MQLDLSDQEQDVLRQLLMEQLPQLRGEVYRTEDYDLRKELQRREETMKSLIVRLGGSIEEARSR